MTASLLLVRLLRFRADELYTVVEEMSGLLGHDALQVTGIDRCCRRGSALLYALIHQFRIRKILRSSVAMQSGIHIACRSISNYHALRVL